MGEELLNKGYDAEIVDTVSTTAIQEKKQYANDILDVKRLNDSEKQKYLALTKNLSINDINSISNYGVEIQSAMTKHSTNFLSTVRATQSGEMGELINNLLTELNYVDVNDLEAPGKFKRMLSKLPIIGGLVKNVEKVLRKYDSISKNIETISNKISASRLLSLRDNNALQVMFDNNVEYCKRIDELIIGGKLKLDEVNTKLEEMMSHSQDYENHEIQDVQEFANNLDKRITDMMTLRYVMKQSLPQIRAVQYNNIAIANKAQSLITTTLPIWRSQLSIAVALQNQKNYIEIQSKVSNTTNEIIKRNAALLKENSINVAKENEKSVIQLETLRKSTTDLIDTIRQVKEIHENGKRQRREAEEEMKSLEKELTKISILTNN